MNYWKIIVPILTCLALLAIGSAFIPFDHQDEKAENQSPVDVAPEALPETDPGSDTSACSPPAIDNVTPPAPTPQMAESIETIYRQASAKSLEATQATAPDTRKALEFGEMLFAAAREVAGKLGEETRQSGEALACEKGLKRGIVGKGDTLTSILQQHSSGEIEHYIGAASKVFSMRAFREGQPYAIVTDEETGRIKRFEYEINENRRLVVDGLEKPRASLEDIEYTLMLEHVAGKVDDNLFQAVADVGETPQLALRLVNIFGSEINFIRDLQPGDSFNVLLEKRFRDGSYRGYDRILAATFTNKGKTYEAYLFRDDKGKPGYYNKKGENIHKTLLQSPLAFTRITSRFSHNRLHPVLGYSRPHLGVDYGAPTGTPVKAVGDGTITRRGWNGANGNQVVIRHGAGLESFYAHLSGFARGLKEGQSVRQGQVIGFVGSTGLSTGSHLDFRLRQNGNFIDPVKAINPRGMPVAKALLSEFGRVRDLDRGYLDGQPLPAKYTVDSILPKALPSHAEQATTTNKNIGKRGAKALPKTKRVKRGKNKKRR